jgi:hypothetical protein
MKHKNEKKTHELKYNYHPKTRLNKFTFQKKINNQNKLPLIINKECKI